MCSKNKIIISLKDGHEIHIHLSNTDTNHLIDQIYSVFSGEFDDNCVEIITNDNEISGKETILIKADEILYVKTQEVIDEWEA